MKKLQIAIFCLASTALVASTGPSSALSIPAASNFATGYGNKQPVARFQQYIMCVAGTAGAMIRAGHSREDALEIARWDCGSYFYGWDRSII